jgi:hypothetical protein
MRRGTFACLVDQYTFINNTLAALQANGFTVGNTATGCNPKVISSVVASYSLFCSPPTYTVSNADQTYGVTAGARTGRSGDCADNTLCQVCLDTWNTERYVTQFNLTSSQTLASR